MSDAKVTISLAVDADAVGDILTLWYLLCEPNHGLWDIFLVDTLPERIGCWLEKLDEVLDPDGEESWRRLGRQWSDEERRYIDRLLAVDAPKRTPDAHDR